MEIKIYSQTLDLLGIIDDFNSFSCSSKYADAGSFKITCNLTKRMMGLLVAGNIIYTDDFAGIIDSISFNQKEEDSTITAQGLDLLGVLDSRIIWTPIFWNASSVEGYLRKIVNENAIITQQARVIPYLALGANKNFTEVTTVQSNYESLKFACTEKATSFDLGYRIKLFPQEKKMYFEVYKGADKTAGNENQIVIGNSFDNVVNQNYNYSNRNQKNCILGVNKNQDTTIAAAADKGLSGLHRKEFYLETSLTQETGITNPQFNEAIIAACNSEFCHHFETNNFDVDVCNVVADLGDKITVRNNEWNLTLEARINQIDRYYQNGKVTTSYIVGNDVNIRNIGGK